MSWKTYEQMIGKANDVSIVGAALSTEQIINEPVALSPIETARQRWGGHAELLSEGREHERQRI